MVDLHGYDPDKVEAAAQAAQEASWSPWRWADLTLSRQQELRAMVAAALKAYGVEPPPKPFEFGEMVAHGDEGSSLVGVVVRPGDPYVSVWWTDDDRAHSVHRAILVRLGES